MTRTVYPKRDDLLSQSLEVYMLPGIEMKWLEDYDSSLLDHIFYVREAGRMLEVPEDQLIEHDQSKYSMEEFPYYARSFHGDKGDPLGFSLAWLHHQNINPHHWEFWIMRSGHTRDFSGADPVSGCLPMPNRYLREMVADWMGASMAYTGSWSIREWYENHKDKINLHPNTHKLLLAILKEIRYGEKQGTAPRRQN